MSTTTHHIWASSSSSSLNKSGMFQATGLVGRVIPVVAFPGSRRQPLILPPLRSSKTFKPLACLHDLHGNKGMIRYHEVELEVRDYELDQFGVVNNAIYANYCQHGSHEMLKNMGINCDEVSRSGEALAVTELTLKFIAPLRSGYKFVVKSRISGTSATRIHCDQFIFKLPNYEPILEAKGTAVWLDSRNRPARLPSCLRSNSAQSEHQYTDFTF